MALAKVLCINPRWFFENMSRAGVDAGYYALKVGVPSSGVAIALVLDPFYRHATKEERSNEIQL